MHLFILLLHLPLLQLIYIISISSYKDFNLRYLLFILRSFYRFQMFILMLKYSNGPRFGSKISNWSSYFYWSQFRRHFCKCVLNQPFSLLVGKRRLFVMMWLFCVFLRVIQLCFDTGVLAFSFKKRLCS